MDPLDIDYDGDRKKVTIACDCCRRRKVRCDGSNPCSNCQRAGFSCAFTDSTQKRPRGPPKGFVALIEDRLHTIERLLVNIVQREPNNSTNPTTTASSSSDDSEALQKLKRPFSLYAKREQEQETDNQDTKEYNGQGTSHTQGPSTHRNRFLQDYNNEAEDLRNALANLNFGSPSSSLPLIQQRHESIPGLPSTLPSIPLPPPDVIQRLIDLYFAHANWTLPILKRSTIIAKLTGADNNALSPLLLYSIMAYGALFASALSSQHAMSGYTCSFFTEKFRLTLDYFLDESRITTVQALMIMSQVENGNGSYRQQSYITMATRMAHSLRLNHPSSDIESAQERSTTFWTLFILDRHLSLTFGEPMTINESFTNVDLPIAEMEELDPSTHTQPHFIARPAQIDALKAYVSLARIMGHIIEHLQSNALHPVLSTWSHVRMITTFEQTLSAWRRELPSFLQFNPETNGSPLAATLSMIYYSLFIMLHYPCLYIPRKRVNRSYMNSLNVCCSSAKILTTTAESVASSATSCLSYPQAFFALVQAAKIHAMSMSSAERGLRAPGYKNLLRTMDIFKRYVEWGVFTDAAQKQLDMYQAILTQQELDAFGAGIGLGMGSSDMSYNMASLLDANNLSAIQNLLPTDDASAPIKSSQDNAFISMNDTWSYAPFSMPPSTQRDTRDPQPLSPTTASFMHLLSDKRHSVSVPSHVPLMQQQTYPRSHSLDEGAPLQSGMAPSNSASPFWSDVNALGHT